MKKKKEPRTLRRLWQVFMAPEDSPAALPLPPSPWHIERLARIPLEHWNILLLAGNSIDPTMAHILTSWSSSGALDTDQISAPPETLRKVITFLEKLDNELESIYPISANVTLLEDYVPDEHRRMLAAVRCVISEALRRDRPFRAWIE